MTNALMSIMFTSSRKLFNVWVISLANMFWCMRSNAFVIFYLIALRIRAMADPNNSFRGNLTAFFLVINVFLRGPYGSPLISNWNWGVLRGPYQYFWGNIKSLVIFQRRGLEPLSPISGSAYVRSLDETQEPPYGYHETLTEFWCVPLV